MSFLASINKQNQPEAQLVELDTSASISNNELTKEEIQLILDIMKNSTFKGEYIEILYNTVIKLQAQFIKLQTK